MSNKPQPSKLAETIPTGIVSIFCGIGAISILINYLVIANILGITGFVFGFVTLRMQVEKLDKYIAIMGMIISVVPIVYTLLM